jgi:hypothetical protein
MRFSFVYSAPERIDDYLSYRSGIVEPDYQAFSRDQGTYALVCTAQRRFFICLIGFGLPTNLTSKPIFSGYKAAC